MDITADFFTSYDLPRSFVVDLTALRKTHHKLQHQFHPDRFMSEGQAEQRQAVQVTAYLNLAYETLKEPLKRAIYLLQLNDMDPLSPSNTSMPMDFLLQQIELREVLEDILAAADPEAQIDAMSASLQAKALQLENEFASAYGELSLGVAETAVRKLQFIVKLQDQLSSLEDELFD